MQAPLVGYLYLAMAIVAEVIATLSLKASEGFTRPAPSLAVVVGYGVAGYCLALCLRTVPVGVAYATWAGVGVVLVAAAAAVLYGQRPDWAGILGMALVVAGVLLLTLRSGMRVG